MSKYVEGGNGKIYEEVTNPQSGVVEYVPVQAEGMRVGKNGVLIPVRSEQVAQQQAAPESHSNFFLGKKSTSAEDKHMVRRQQMLANMVNEAVLSRVTDVSGPDIRKVKDEEWMEMRKDPGFEPLASYEHKLTTPSGKRVRPVLAGEVGVYQGKICVLEDGEKIFGGAQLINVNKEPTNE